MKKLFNSVLVFLLITIISIVITHPTFAATCSGVNTSLIECEGGGDAGVWHILILIVEILSIGIGITALVGILFFGIQYLTAAGDVSKVTKAKRRMLEIVLGLIGWIIIFSFSEWLMPGGKFNFTSDITEIQLSLDKSSLETGKSTKTTVTFTPAETSDKTYSLSTDNSSVASVTGTYVKCRGEGTTTITATSVNGKTATATVTCTKPVEPEPTPVNSGSGSGSGDRPSNTWFECDNCPANGSQISQAESASFDRAFAQEENSITYEGARQLAKAKGISDENFYSIVAWARTENHENTGYGEYFAYLCNSVMVNRALNGEYLPTQMDNWSTITVDGKHVVWFYAYSQFLGSHDASHCQRDEIYGTGETVCGYKESNLKLAYMALKYTYPNINSCYGGIPNNILVYEKDTYIGW